MSYKRIIVSYIIVLTALFFCALRVCSIALTPQLLETANNTTSKKIVLRNVRGTIYDCNLNRLTNNFDRYAVLITNNPVALKSVGDFFTGEEMVEIINEIRENKFALRITDRPIYSEGIVSFAYKNGISNESLAKHIIGYTDSNHRGVSGLEKAFDDILYNEEQIYINVGISGQGDLLLGSAKIVNHLSQTQKGLVITIDSKIQQAAEEASSKLNKGAVLITEVETGKIKAMVSRPDYNPENIGDYLNDESAPLINRALENFNVGSVFKPCVAAAAIENGCLEFCYNCNGIANIDGLDFRCHNLSGHGTVNMEQAIKYSCNTYFYNLAVKLGADKIYDMAKKAGFENFVSLTNGFFSAKGSLGDIKKLQTSNRALANLSIGQGDLMLSTVVISNIYSAIANGGIYYSPSIYEGELAEGGIINKYEKSTPIKLMKKTTADIIKKYLKGVLEEGGTGVMACPKTVSAAGKTATAETGIIKNGEKVINTWFCGFFPYDEPKYTVVVLSENSDSSCGDVFATIADKIGD